MDRSSGFWWGIILIVLGALFLAENLDIISVDVAIREYWPVLFVLWGVWLLTGSDAASRRAARRAARRTDRPSGDIASNG